MSKAVWNCTNCGMEARAEKGQYSLAESGLPNVSVKGITVWKRQNCGNEDPVIPRMDTMFRVLALAVAAKRKPLAGSEIRFLRKYVGMNGAQFSGLLHTDKSTLSKWENDAVRVGPKSDLLIRAVALHLIQAGAKAAETIIRDFGLIDEETKAAPGCIEVDSETLQYQYA